MGFINQQLSKINALGLVTSTPAHCIKAEGGGETQLFKGIQQT